jgi:hypothetical protein
MNRVYSINPTAGSISERSHTLTEGNFNPLVDLVPGEVEPMTQPENLPGILTGPVHGYTAAKRIRGEDNSWNRE